MSSACTGGAAGLADEGVCTDYVAVSVGGTSPRVWLKCTVGGVSVPDRRRSQWPTRSLGACDTLTGSIKSWRLSTGP